MIIDPETKLIELNDANEFDAAGCIETEYALADVGLLYGKLKFAAVYIAAVEEALKRERSQSDRLLSDAEMRNWKDQGYLNTMITAVVGHVPHAQRRRIDAFYDGSPAFRSVFPSRRAS